MLKQKNLYVWNLNNGKLNVIDVGEEFTKMNLDIGNEFTKVKLSNNEAILSSEDEILFVDLVKGKHTVHI